jgi:hypothetical protein
MLFFLAPAFRQAFRVSQTQWHYVLHMDPQYREPGLAALARRAEQKQDAEALVFVAVRHWEASERVRLAEEAVRLDQNLTWVYAMVYACSPRPSELDQRVQKFERWDPQNALPYLITAECIDVDQVIREKIPQRAEDEGPAWRSALAAAFQSPKLDTYVKRLKELDRRVVFRYGVDDPYQTVESEYPCGLPSYAAWDSSRYAHLLLESGDMLEARGDRKSAVEKYWAVARFGQTIGTAGGFMMSQRLQEAYKRLGALSQKERKNEQAELYAYLAGKADQAEKEERASFLQRANDGTVSRWNASVVRASGLMMLFFAALVLVCVLSVTAKGRSLRLSALRVSRLAVTLGIGSATGLLLSSALLYMSYRPYAESLQRFVRTGEGSQIRELNEFLDYTLVPLGAQGFRNRMDFVFYFWLGVTALCVVALLLMAARHFQNRRQAKAAA